METYATKQEPTTIDGVDYYIKSLKDRNEFYDPQGVAAALGISSAMWSISGMLWPSNIILARIISKIPLDNLRILEVGCGIALASLVARSRGANITASDYHPLTQHFLDENTALNQLEAIKYFHGNWNKPITNAGRFDLIIGSDLLYEQEHPKLLATFIHCHLSPGGRVILIDPGRKLANKFARAMAELNYRCDIEVIAPEEVMGKWVKCRSYTFQRCQ